MNSDSATVIETDNLTKMYGDAAALAGVSISIPRGAIGLLGPNGAGKSTLIQLLLGLKQPTHGTARVLGLNSQENHVAIRQRVGYMPEADCLPLDSTAHDVVSHFAEVSGLPATDARLRASELLYLCGLGEQRFRPVQEFSTGMKQRVKLAQALVHDPDLVFLDEPTSGMDPSGHQDMLDLVQRIWNEMGISIALSSHILEDVEKICDYVVMLEDGAVIAADRVDTLLNSSEHLDVETDHSIEFLYEYVISSGYEATLNESLLTIQQVDDPLYDLVRDLAVSKNLAIRSMKRRRISLEEVYIRNMHQDEHETQVLSHV